MKIKMISGNAPPYSSKMLFPDATYIKENTRKPKIIYPYGLLYLELEIKIRYNHKKIPVIIKTKKSDNNPRLKILRLSDKVKELCVIG
jgi:uncharacterized protein YqkB